VDLDRETSRDASPHPERHPGDGKGATLHHRWIGIAAGRVCTECKLAQANGQFDDKVPCRPVPLDAAQGD
jgi:hypothetical protein